MGGRAGGPADDPADTDLAAEDDVRRRTVPRPTRPHPTSDLEGAPPACPRPTVGTRSRDRSQPGTRRARR